MIFPGKCVAIQQAEQATYSPLVVPGDIVSDRVKIKGTTYRAGHVLVTKAISCDVLEVGTVHEIVLRENKVLFLLSLHHASRSFLGFFEALPCETVGIVQYEDLADFKPLIGRGKNACFPFVLHHNVMASVLHGKFFFVIALIAQI